MIYRCLITFFLLVSCAYTDDSYPSLWDCEDPELQARLEAVVRKKNLMSHVEAGRLALALVDISDIHQPRVAGFRQDQMMYAASLPKVAILLGAFVQVERGKLKLDETLMTDMTDMIRYSSNAAASRVLDRVGRKSLLAILQSPQYRLYDPKHGGGLWVGKAYARQGAYQRDPLHNLSHGATTLQVARFYYMLETQQLVGAELSRQMKDILANPGIPHKFVAGLKARPDAVVYRKSGSWNEFHADSALVETSGKSFIIVGLAKHPQGGRWLADLAVPLHDLIVED